MTRDARKPTVLITDLDNTLWDWFTAWYESFSQMLARLSTLSGVPRAVLEQEMRKVHRIRGTAEYSQLLNELPSLTAPAQGEKPLMVFDEAIHVLNSARRRSTTLYPNVRETLDQLREHQVLIIAYTESVSYWTEWRIKHTGLDGVIDVLYSAPDHDLPTGVTVQDLRTGRDEEYGLKSTQHRHVERGALKPNAGVLRSILRDCGCSSEEALYVGDSLMKDIAMAQSVGVLDAHAAYGMVQDRPEYELLRRVSHWTDADVERERLLASSKEVTPTFTLAKGFDEILRIFHLDGASS